MFEPQQQSAHDAQAERRQVQRRDSPDIGMRVRHDHGMAKKEPRA
ncbi:MAG TPA: hypothetical protein VFW04_09800 [Gemmatimonadaceae bacterium]|nr:hypothetical protein [Gemmatimonadaceae bacterium]